MPSYLIGYRSDDHGKLILWISPNLRTLERTVYSTKGSNPLIVRTVLNTPVTQSMLLLLFQVKPSTGIKTRQPVQVRRYLSSPRTSTPLIKQPAHQTTLSTTEEGVRNMMRSEL
jgi:hypothetical protein